MTCPACENRMSGVYMDDCFTCFARDLARSPRPVQKRIGEKRPRRDELREAMLREIELDRIQA